jgi:maltokinase
MGGPVVTAGLSASVARYPLGFDMALVITPDPDAAGQPTWTCRLQRQNGDQTWRDVEEGDGAAEAFVDVLRHTVTVPADGFRVLRLVPPPEATGERAVEADQTNHSVVVGERVVVKWVRHLNDTEHPAPLTLTHLAEVRFLGVPVTHGMLTWRAPSGREIPCAVVTTYLPRARDGWAWGPDLVEQQLGTRKARGAADAAGLGVLTGSIPITDSWVDDFSARIGRLAAKLHVALAMPSKVMPGPVRYAGPAAVRAWHAAAVRRLDAVERIARDGTLEDAGQVLLPRIPVLRATIDELLVVAAALPDDPDRIAAGEGILVQRIHGDLHAGQLLRWPGGMAIVDFDGNPVLHLHAGIEDGVDPLHQPAARDLAQLLLSIDYVGRVTDKRSNFSLTAAIDGWSLQARDQLLQAYRAELAMADRQHLLDDRLLRAFQAEQVCRELLYACEHLPRWAYAPLAGLRLMSVEVDEPHPSGRHRAAPRDPRTPPAGITRTPPAGFPGTPASGLADLLTGSPGGPRRGSRRTPPGGLIRRTPPSGPPKRDH